MQFGGHFKRVVDATRSLDRQLCTRLIESELCTDWAEVHDLLRRIRVVLIDQATLAETVEQRLIAYFSRSDGKAVEAADERRALAEFVLTKLGVPLTGQDILDFLRSRGVARWDPLTKPDVRRAVENSVEHFLRIANEDLINGQPILRVETDTAIGELLNAGNSKSVLISGNAGLGKSCVMAQIVDRLRSNLAVLAVRLDELEGVHSTAELGSTLGLDGSPVTALAGIADGRPCVLVVDQLDAVSELSGRKSLLWDVFQRFARKLPDFLE